jgi:Tfp pilus assembly major pilin PilA
MRIAGIAAVLVMVSFAACTKNDSGKKPAEWKGELPIASAFLRQQLPPEVVTYARVPNLLGLLTMPKGSQLDAALRSEANITSVKSIQEGLAKNVLTLPSLSNPWIKFIADAVRSPIEVAGFGNPNPAVLVGATLAPRNKADFDKLFADLGRMQPAISLAAPLDDRGIGELVGLPLMAFVKFDPANGRLLLFAAPKTDRAAFEKVLASLPAKLKDHPMYALEQKIDTSGHGLFVWADSARIVPMAQDAAPFLSQGLRQAGLGGLRAVALGFGTANGKGRMSLVLDVGNDRKARPFPVVTNEVKATAVGEPDAAFLLSIPSKAEMSRLESMLLDALPPEARRNWEQAKAKAKEQIGIDVEDIFAAIGPDLVFLYDQAGDYTAVRIRDRDQIMDLVKKIAAKTGSEPDEQKIGGTTFQHWRMPSIYSIAANSEVTAGGSADADIRKLLGRTYSHMYWIREGDYIYMAGTPQPLIDRVNAGAKTEVGEWLETKQRVDTSASLFAATGSVRKMPRRTYEAYVGTLQFLADLTDAKFDVWSMPTATQLGLADKGALGFSINLGEPYLSLELTYENNPGEVFFGGNGAGAVAVAGILAAVAIPAYQDYTIRAQVTEGLNLAAIAKAAVAESFVTRGAMPKDRRAAGLPPSAATASRYVESVDISNGVILVTYGKAANLKLRGKTLAITPFATPDRDIGWSCGYARAPAGTRPLVPESARGRAVSTIEPKYLPSACR